MQQQQKCVFLPKPRNVKKHLPTVFNTIANLKYKFVQVQHTNDFDFLFFRQKKLAVLFVVDLKKKTKKTDLLHI
jgi:hypothetical protein